MKDFIKPPLIREYTAVIKRIAIYCKIDPDLLLRNTDIRILQEDAISSLVVELSRRIAAATDTTEEYHSVEIPLDWWQHFKQRWFNDWMLKRWPIKMRIIKLPAVVTRMCPHVRLNDNTSHMKWLHREPFIPTPYDD